MSTPKISVILPCYNVETYLRECLDSAIIQTLSDIEIICVNDGSKDSTLDIIKEYAEKDSRVKYIDKPNEGYGKSMNRGMDAATGEYIAILETDDYIKPNMYEVLYKYAEENDLDLIKADYEIFLGEGTDRTFSYMSSCRKKEQYYRVINPTEEPDIFNARMNTWTGIYRRSFLNQYHIRHNETAGASYQDNGFWFQTFLWAKRIMFIDRAFYQLRRDNPNSSVHNKGKVFCIFEEYAFIEKIVRSDSEKEKKLIKMFQKKKFDNCLYHYSRVGDEFKMDFLRRMSDEFKEARAAGELDESIFIGTGFANLTKIMDDPHNYYIDTVEKAKANSPEEKIKNLELQLKKTKKELADIKNSKSYKIGRGITWLPRKIKGGIQCVKDNGWKYTILHFFEKIRRKK